MGEIVNEVVPIGAIHDHPRNYRQHPDEQVMKLRASIARFGQVRSVVLQRGAPGQYLMVAGHGIKRAATEEGLDALRADIIPADWSEEQILGYLIADNQGGAEDDPRTLSSILQEQRELGYDLAALGSSEEELDELLRQLREQDGEVDFGALVEPQGGGGAADLQWSVAVTVTDADARDRLVSDLRGMGFEPEVSSVRAV